MASDVIGVNSVYDSIKDTKYSDHLLENNILDEPLYENGEVVKKLYQANNKLSKSLMRIHEETLSPVKEENIYENISFHENKLNSINEIKNGTNLEEHENDNSPEENLNFSNINDITSECNKSLYTSTISLTIGKPVVSMEETDSPEENELNFNITTRKDREGSTESNDETFKSSYAKSLIHSYRKSAPSIQCSNATIKNEKPIVGQMVTKQDTNTQNEVNSIETQTKVLGLTNLDSQSRMIEGLESKISSLTDNILLKDKELEKLRQELMFMKLECNRFKAENRSLKASLNNEISSRSLLNVDGHPHSPVSSVSSDSDTWTLQQQIMSLNAQLEKAELSRHAYEAATKQLVHFLQTINSTLTTVGGPDTLFQSPFTSQNTSELLTNLETSLMENRNRTTISPKIKTNPYFENSRDVSYLSHKADFRSNLESDRKSPCPLKADSIVGPSSYKEKENVQPSREDNDTAGKDILTCPILEMCDKKDAEALVVNLKDVTFNKRGNNEGKKRSSPQRRFSISQKIWNPAKRPLVRSGSVNNLPTELSAYPRVSRAVSTHCVALGKLETLPNECDEAPDPSSSTSQRIKSSKAKDFFSSLKNLFRPEEKASQDINKKKSSSQASQKSNKVKIDFLSSSPASSSSPSPLSLVTPAAAATNQKRHSIKALSVTLHESPLHDAEVQTSTPNSTFYVPFRCTPKDVETKKAQEDMETSKFGKATTLQEEEEEMEGELMSGPKEISLTLTKESEDIVDTPVSSKSKEEEWLQLPSRAPFLTYVTGGGISSFSISNDDLRFDNKDMSCFKTYGRADGTKSLEFEESMTSWKEKLSRVKSCCGDELDKVEKCSNRSSRSLTRRRSDFDAVGLKLWKLSRESFRAKACRVEFV